jgi:hypothetical protein
MDERETGLKPLDGFRLKGVLIYCEPLHAFEIWNSGNQEFIKKMRIFMSS